MGGTGGTGDGWEMDGGRWMLGEKLASEIS